MARDFRKIKAWKYADDLAVLVYTKTKDFPKDEIYGIISQLRRAVVSVAANIVEGANREHKKEYLQFLYIARASLAETEYLLHLSNRLGYLQDESYEEIDSLREETSKTLFGLIKSVKNEI